MAVKTKLTFINIFVLQFSELIIRKAHQINFSILGKTYKFQNYEGLVFWYYPKCSLSAGVMYTTKMKWLSNLKKE
jgi:hypothetical protein